MSEKQDLPPKDASKILFWLFDEMRKVIILFTKPFISLTSDLNHLVLVFFVQINE